MIEALDPAWIALIGTVIATVGLKLLEHWLGKSKNQVDDATQIRNELRTQVTSQKEEIRQLEDELEEWRTKYYDLRDEFSQLKIQLQVALEEIKRYAEQVQKQIPPPPLT